MTSMRAKLQCSYVFPHRDADGKTLSEQVSFHAVCKSNYADSELDEDNTYARMSPSANFQITIANPALFGKFEPGQKFYVDFHPVEG
ncbi:MAG: hypothetical protein KGJ57_17340 [Sphingomonadales bacterium]|nr:hypothetical protein [Sphingomonadales bacterium]MDE2171162.1 hypothetical protein [Sphingomonadales bacterium]